MTSAPERPIRSLVATLVILATGAGFVAPSSAGAAGTGTLALAEAEVATGQTLSVSGDGCTSDATTERSVRSLLLIGEPGGQVAAGYADGPDGAPAPLGVPGWVDPNASAEVHARCIEHQPDGELRVAFSYEPLGVDVVPGTGPSPVAAASRTEMAQGRAAIVSVSGCDPASGGVVEGALFAGADLSGLTWTDPIAVAEPADDALQIGPFELDGHVLPAGSYVLVARCGTEAASFSAVPVGVTITPDPAVHDARVGVAADRRSLAATGAACAAKEVAVTLIALPAEIDPASQLPARLRQARSGGDAITQSVAPARDGTWSVSWTPDLLAGTVSVDARCGDVRAAGFAYDPARDDFALDPPPVPTVPTTAPAHPTPPVAAPATAVPGEVVYTG